MKKLSLFTALLLPLVFAGCQKHVFADFRPLDQAGMWSENLEAMKKLNPSDAEIAQVVTLKQAGNTDTLCLGLMDSAHAHQHTFTSSAAVNSLHSANFSDDQILSYAQHEKLDSISTEAVMLRLLELSDASIDTILRRRMNGTPTMSSAEIGRLKNTQLSEREIMARIESGMTDAQADIEAAFREKGRAHAGTGFTRVHGRRR